MDAPANSPDSAAIPRWARPIAVALVVAGVVLLFASMMLGCIALTVILGGLLEAEIRISLEAVVVSYSAAIVAIGLLAACCIGAVRRRRSALAIAGALGVLCGVIGSFPPVDLMPLWSLLVGAMAIGVGSAGVAALGLADRLGNPHHWRVVRLRRDECPGCGYSIVGLPEPRCPECGARWSAEEHGGAVSPWTD